MQLAGQREATCYEENGAGTDLELSSTFFGVLTRVLWFRLLRFVSGVIPLF